jgi:mannose-6-phosphate isomerase-like protein (cupin superfamily)
VEEQSSRELNRLLRAYYSIEDDFTDSEDCRERKNITNKEGRIFNLLGDAVRVILSCDDTAGCMTLIEQRSQPGTGIPLHVHANEDEIFQILEGEIEFKIGDKTVVANPGTVVYAPKNLPHSFRVSGTQPAHFQVTAIPGGLEKMFDEITQLPFPPEPQKLRAACEKYGVRFVSPPAEIQPCRHASCTSSARQTA